MKFFKEKIAGITGSVSGAASILGSWQVCHNVCLGLVALLSVIGIAVVGMPLAFLTKLAVPFWTAAVALLSLSGYLYLRKGCISKNLLVMNFGFIIAGVPFKALDPFLVIFWTVGGAFAATGIFLIVKDKYLLRRERNKDETKDANKNFQDYFIYGLLFIVIAGLILSLAGSFSGGTAAATYTELNGRNAAGNIVKEGASFKTVSIGSTGQGDVSIDLTPDYANGKLVVKISANTHSVDLSQFDLKKMTTLKYGGKTVSPSSAPSLSGHHASGILIFDLEEKMDSFTIKIEGIPLIEERIFTW